MPCLGTVRLNIRRAVVSSEIGFTEESLRVRRSLGTINRESIKSATLDCIICIIETHQRWVIRRQSRVEEGRSRPTRNPRHRDRLAESLRQLESTFDREITGS